MNIPPLAFMVTDWQTLPETRRPGANGYAVRRTVNIGDIRIRLIDYTPGYLADHWCDRGHILFVFEGELVSELKDGRKTILRSGMSYQVSDGGDAPHRPSTNRGARIFIVD